MKKILIAIAGLDFCAHYPLVSSLLLLGYVALSSLTEEENKQLTEFTMSIISNGREFTKYLSDKARALNISLPNLRNRIVNDLEDKEEEESLDATLDTFMSKIKDQITEEELENINSSHILQEKLVRVAKEAVAVPETVWRPMSLKKYYDDQIELSNAEEDDRYFFKECGVDIDTDCEEIFTEKDFRVLKRKVKAVCAQLDDSEKVKRYVLMGELSEIYTAFSNQKVDFE